MRPPSVMLFDLGGVLIENPGFGHFNAMLAKQVALAELKAAWLRSPTVRRFESGQSTAELFAAGVLSEWQVEMEAAEFMRQFESWPKDVSDASVALIRSLRARYKVMCLSNSNALHWQRFAPFLAEFDLAMSSHLLGLVKPDAACFNLAVQRCGVTAGEIAFFDDSQDNVDAAQRVGLRAFLVDGVDDVRERLRLEGW